MGAHRKDISQHTRPGPAGDLLKAIVVAEHIPHLDQQLLFLRPRHYALPLGPIVAGGFVVPHVFARRDDLLGLIQALGVAPFRGDGHDAVVLQQLPLVGKEVGALERAVGLYLPAALCIRLEDSYHLHLGVALHRHELTACVTVFRAVLGHANLCHFLLSRLIFNASNAPSNRRPPPG